MRDRAADVEAADEALARKVSGLDVALALDRRGFDDIARAIVGMQRQRVSVDYLQTSAVIDPDGLVHSAVNDPNLYTGPGTGYRLEGARWETLQALPHVVDAATMATGGGDAEEIVRSPSAPPSPLRSARRSTASTTATCWRRCPRAPRKREP